MEDHATGLDEDGRTAALLLVVEVRRLSALVEDLMEISRLDAGVAAVVWESIDLRDAVEGALRARGWVDQVQATLPRGLVTFADPPRLDAVVGNLVGNALQHGRPPVEVAVCAEGEALLIRVADGARA